MKHNNDELSKYTHIYIYIHKNKYINEQTYMYTTMIIIAMIAVMTKELAWVIQIFSFSKEKIQ